MKHKFKAIYANKGVDSSTAFIKKNLQSAGFKFHDIGDRECGSEKGFRYREGIMTFVGWAPGNIKFDISAFRGMRGVLVNGLDGKERVPKLVVEGEVWGENPPTRCEQRAMSELYNELTNNVIDPDSIQVQFVLTYPGIKPEDMIYSFFPDYLAASGFRKTEDLDQSRSDETGAYSRDLGSTKFFGKVASGLEFRVGFPTPYIFGRTTKVRSPRDKIKHIPVARLNGEVYQNGSCGTNVDCGMNSCGQLHALLTGYSV